MANIKWWQTPQLHREESERKTSWLDLFSDLIFVVIIAELAHYLKEDLSWQGVMGFVLLFIPAWWVWISQTFYNERFEQDDVSHRVYIFVLMLGVIALALNIHYGLDKTAQGYALSYAALRLLIIIMWWRAGRHNPVFRPVSIGYNSWFSVSLVLWVISVFVPSPYRFILWGLGLLCDLYGPIPTLKYQRSLPRFNQSSRLPERFGLFIIIVLGEAVVSVVSAAAETKELTITTAIAVALGFGLAFGFWWIYFDQIQSRRSKTGLWWALGWSYLHLPLVVALTAASVGVLKIISYEGKPLPEEVRWLICGSIALAFLSLGLLELTLNKALWSVQVLRVLRFGSAGVTLLIGFLGSGLNSILILALLFALGLSQMLYGAYLWFRAGGYQSESEPLL